MKTLKLSLLGVIVLIVLAACSRESVQGTLTRQDFGTAAIDSANDVAAPSGGVGAVVVGRTNGALDGVNKGSQDAFIRKYDGGVVWAQQFGTRAVDRATDVAVTNAGVSYVVGVTFGALGFKVGDGDVFLRKHDANGVLQWTRQFGTAGRDDAHDVSLDSSGNIYVLSRDSNAAFTIRKFSPSGSLLKTITNTSTGIFSVSALAVDSSGSIFVLTGFSSGETSFAKLFKFNSAGTLVASPNVFTGAGPVSPVDLIVDGSNNLYFSVIDGDSGAFVRKVNTAGSNIWIQRIEPAVPSALALDSNGSLYVTGLTLSALPGFSHAGSADIVAMKLSPTNGSRLWTRQFGGNAFDQGFGIAVSDAVYIAGDSFSTPNLVGDTPHGNGDAFLAQLDLTTGAVLGVDQ